MKVLKKTNKFGIGRGSHSHIVYLNDESGLGLCSTDANHSHEITFIPPQEQQVDQSGQVIQQGSPGGWVVQPAFDGHTHELMDYIAKPPKVKQEEDEAVEEVRQLFKTARELERSSRTKADESEKFYMGEHFDSAEKTRLEDLGRACVTINTIEKNVDHMCGIQRQERTDIRYIPQEGGDQRVADILNIVTKNILSRCYFTREESKVFEDQVIGGRGFFNVWVDQSKDLRGDIIVEKFPCTDIVLGPHEKEDLSDCEYAIKHRWYSKAKLTQLFEDKAEDIQKDWDEMFIDSTDVAHVEDPYSYPTKQSRQTIGDDIVVDIGKKEYRVLECWNKLYTKGWVITNPSEEFYFNAYGWDSKDIKSAKTLPNFFVVEQNVTKFRIRKIAGTVLLADENPAELPADDFFIIPVYAKKRGGEFWGKVESAKDAQKYVNKNYSLAIDVGNKMANYGWLYDSSTFPDNEKQKFIRNSSSPGFVVEVNDVNRPPVKVEGSKFPSELVQLMQLGKDQVADLMNIITGANGANESGSLFEQRRNQRLLGSEYLFDNLSFAKQKLGRLLIKLIQRYYTPDRIVRIVRSAHSKEAVKLGGTPASDFTDQEIYELLSTTDLAELDVEVSESAWSPSMRTATFGLLKDMLQAGMPIPPEAIFQFGDMPQDVKDNLTQMMAQQQQAASNDAQVKADAEIQKTLIAQGQIPPEVSQKFGLQSPPPQVPPTEGNLAPGILGQ